MVQNDLSSLYRTSVLGDITTQIPLQASVFGQGSFLGSNPFVCGQYTANNPYGCYTTGWNTGWNTGSNNPYGVWMNTMPQGFGSNYGFGSNFGGSFGWPTTNAHFVPVYTTNTPLTNQFSTQIGNPFMNQFPTQVGNPLTSQLNTPFTSHLGGGFSNQLHSGYCGHNFTPYQVNTPWGIQHVVACR